MQPDFLDLAGGRRIAYHRRPGKTPGVVFLGGFRSDMTGTKATFLEAFARERGQAFLRFDYTGHGASSGAFDDCAIGDWLRDARDAILHLTDGPQILVGSSMGGWIGLLLARAIPDRIMGLVGIAAAPDFTEDAMFAAFTPAQRHKLFDEGFLDLPADYSEEPYRITRRLIDDGRENLVLRRPLYLPFPVRLLHGLDDADVSVSVALRTIEHASGPDIRLTLVKGADHRFSEPDNLDLLGQTLDTLLAAAHPA
jgi:pimeloyl-ACP methyl ester carboxylesterase